MALRSRRSAFLAAKFRKDHRVSAFISENLAIHPLARRRRRAQRVSSNRSQTIANSIASGKRSNSRRCVPLRILYDLSRFSRLSLKRARARLKLLIIFCLIILSEKNRLGRLIV